MSGPDSPPSTPASLWLNREADVVAHLFFAAAEIGTVIVEIGGEKVKADLDFPRTESQSVQLTVTDTVSDVPFRPVAGTVARVSYQRGPASYSWLTNVVEASSPRQWSLAYPTAIERNERRIVMRHRVLGRAGFACTSTWEMASRALPLFDASAAVSASSIGPTSGPSWTGRASRVGSCSPTERRSRSDSRWPTSDRCPAAETTGRRLSFRGLPAINQVRSRSPAAYDWADA